MDRTILVIEDDRKTVDLIRLYLERDEYQVVVAFDGRMGLEIARRVHPALVILDLMLPSVDGLEVCRILRQRNQYSHRHADCTCNRRGQADRAGSGRR